MWNIKTQCILFIIPSCAQDLGALVLDRPICKEIQISAHCHCRNFVTNMQTLLTSLGSWVISQFLDQWLVPWSMIVPGSFWTLDWFVFSPVII